MTIGPRFEIVCTMKKAISVFLMLLGLAAIVGGSFYLWGRRQWRVVVEVNGHTMTAGELRARGKGLLESAKRDEHLVVPNNRAKQAEARHYYEAEAARAWVFKVLMLDEALARKLQATPAEAQESVKQMEERLKPRGMTVEDYFRRGPLPEEMLRREFEEAVLVAKLLKQEVESKISLTPDEITKQQEELQRMAMLTKKLSPKEIDRKMTIDALRKARYMVGTKKFFESLRARADVKSPDYPEIESFRPTPEEELARSASALALTVAVNAAKKKRSLTRPPAGAPAAAAPANNSKGSGKEEGKK